MNMIEKVALAMVRKAKAGPDEVHSLDAVQMSGTEDFIALAKAAIEAMRYPTALMRGEFVDPGSGVKWTSGEWYDSRTPETFDRSWSAAVGAALEET